MAFKQTFELVDNFGIEVKIPDVYCRVSNFIYDNLLNEKKEKQALFVLDLIHSGNTVKKFSYSFVPNIDGGNFIAQAYAHLKTLPEFAGAADC
jgi:hypothetical protein